MYSPMGGRIARPHSSTIEPSWESDDTIENNPQKEPSTTRGAMVLDSLARRTIRPTCLIRDLLIGFDSFGLNLLTIRAS